MTLPKPDSTQRQHNCIIRLVAPYGLHVDVSDLGVQGLLRITEMLNPSLLQADKATLIGTSISARILGKERADGPLILTQR